jgi:NAD(P)-dependent dehydrogenase (short-subunit alcohol dehydrogenase family)
MTPTLPSLVPSPRALLDRALDLAVVPGFGAPGYRLRSGGWSGPPPVSRVTGADVIVTGASAGIGEAAAAGLAARGARVHMVARDPDRLAAAAARVEHQLGSDARAPVTWECDLSDLDAVRDFAGRFRERDHDLRGVLHNAGVLVQDRRRTAQGHELTLATHVLGPLLLTGLLAPELRAAVPSRVVFVSSGGMYTARVHADDLELERKEFDGSRFYAHAKRLQVIAAELLAERWRADGIAVYSMHPGWVRTAGLDEALPRFARITRPLLRDPRQGADTAVWLLAAPEAPSGPSGLWHDRQPRPLHRLPRTRETESERRATWEELVRLSGFDDLAAERDPHGVTPR